MKKVLFFRIITCIIFFLLFFSQCSRDTTTGMIPKEALNSVSVSSLIVYNKITKQSSAQQFHNSMKPNIGLLASKNPDYEFHTMEATLVIEGDHPVFQNVTDVKNYLQENADSITATFNLYLDEDQIEKVIVEDGNISDIISPNISMDGKKYPCTYNGIRTCVDYGIHHQNWFQMTQCILEGFDCVVEWYVNCAIDNC